MSETVDQYINANPSIYFKVDVNGTVIPVDTSKGTPFISKFIETIFDNLNLNSFDFGLMIIVAGDKITITADEKSTIIDFDPKKMVKSLKEKELFKINKLSLKTLFKLCLQEKKNKELKELDKQSINVCLNEFNDWLTTIGGILNGSKFLDAQISPTYLYDDDRILKTNFNLNTIGEFINKVFDINTFDRDTANGLTHFVFKPYTKFCTESNLNNVNVEYVSFGSDLGKLTELNKTGRKGSNEWFGIIPSVSNSPAIENKFNVTITGELPTPTISFTKTTGPNTYLNINYDEIKNRSYCYTTQDFEKWNKDKNSFGKVIIYDGLKPIIGIDDNLNDPLFAILDKSVEPNVYLTPNKLLTYSLELDPANYFRKEISNDVIYIRYKNVHLFKPIFRHYMDENAYIEMKTTIIENPSRNFVWLDTIGSRVHAQHAAAAAAADHGGSKYSRRKNKKNNKMTYRKRITRRKKRSNRRKRITRR